MHYVAVSSYSRYLITTTTTHLEEARHRFISTADLDLVEGGLLSAARGVVALHLGLVGVIPSTLTTKDILALLLLEVLSAV